METIEFYGRSKDYFEFSNFYPATIRVDGKYWPTTEHYFQAMKFRDPKLQQRVAACGTPSAAAKMGRDRSLPLRNNWESVKEGFMKTALLAKFSQHEDLKILLLSTKDAYLVEASPVDDYWGWGSDKKGKNRLGHLLMEVREELREAT
jgi:ribA/ribD-fused uncharacterized protein